MYFFGDKAAQAVCGAMCSAITLLYHCFTLFSRNGNTGLLVLGRVTVSPIVLFGLILSSDDLIGQCATICVSVAAQKMWQHRPALRLVLS